MLKKNTELLYIQNKASYMHVYIIYILHSIYTFTPQKRIGFSNSYFIEWAGTSQKAVGYVSIYVFLRTYYVYKKITANHAAAISPKHSCEAALEKFDCLRKGGDSRESGCTRLNYRVMLI